MTKADKVIRVHINGILLLCVNVFKCIIQHVLHIITYLNRSPYLSLLKFMAMKMIKNIYTNTYKSKKSY